MRDCWGLPRAGDFWATHDGSYRIFHVRFLTGQPPDMCGSVEFLGFGFDELDDFMRQCMSLKLYVWQLRSGQIAADR